MTMSFEIAMNHLRALNYVFAQAQGFTPEEAKVSFSMTLDAAHVMTARTLTDINPETVMTADEAQTFVAVAAAHFAVATGKDPQATGKRLAAAGMIATADMLVRAT